MLYTIMCTISRKHGMKLRKKRAFGVSSLPTARFRLT
ncbi:hypothetical protein C357_02224 [Citreicella sp. 357]|nr:hypothetical protein C357_02224 [Citreicella sp. 357]